MTYLSFLLQESQHRVIRTENRLGSGRVEPFSPRFRVAVRQNARTTPAPRWRGPAPRTRAGAKAATKWPLGEWINWFITSHAEDFKKPRAEEFMFLYNYLQTEAATQIK